jgi:hypothetical protein
VAIKITQDNITKILPEAHEIDARIKKLIAENTTYNSVNSKADYYGFPSIGKQNVIYKAEDTKKLYQWKPDNNGGGHYEELVSTSSEMTNITRINGGVADTTFNDN